MKFPATLLLLPFVPALGFIDSPALKLPTADQPLSFNRHVLPILSDRCYLCHGPDSASRKAGLRLDKSESAVGELPETQGKYAVVPGKPEASEMVRRMLSRDPDEVMPPPDSHKTLAPRERDVLVRWIKEGAVYEKHWAFQPPVKAAPTADTPAGLDALIHAKQAERGLKANPPADPATLVRRLALDLTGLPPDPELAAGFVRDPSPTNYRKVVDQLLASPHYGEHMARYWLDSMRYADTHGYHFDNERSVWPYRDWVVDAFNTDKPFDQFTIEQLAGDLLPNATTNQLVATACVRMHPTTNEGGIIDDEYRFKYTVDRVETFGMTWLGLTVGCAVCHDHKYDPIATKEFYQLYSFFNATTEGVRDGNVVNPAPVLMVPSMQQQAQAAELTRKIDALDLEITAPHPEMDAKQTAWEKQTAAALREIWSVLKPVALTSEAGTELKEENGYILATGPNPDKDDYVVEALLPAGKSLAALQLEVEPVKQGKKEALGRSESGNFVLSEILAEVTEQGKAPQPLEFVRAEASHSQNGYDISLAIDGVDAHPNGWGGDVAVPGGRQAVFTLRQSYTPEKPARVKVSLRFQTSFARHTLAKFRLSSAIEPHALSVQAGEWTVLGPIPAKKAEALMKDYGPERVPHDPTAEYAGQKWRDAKIPDGKPFATPDGENVHYFHRLITADRDWLMPVSFGSDDAIKVWINGSLVHDNDTGRGVKVAEDPLTLPLHKGDNHLLVKLANYGGAGGLAFEWYRNRLSESTDVVWLEDKLEDGPGGTPGGGWSYVTAAKDPVYSGTVSRRQESAGLVQHFFSAAKTPLVQEEGDVWYAWVFLDPKNPPQSIMLQWFSNTWRHRAYWGPDKIDYGKDKTKPDQDAYRYLGPLPETGKWVKLEVPASGVGMTPGLKVLGMAWSQFGGLAWWDQSGVRRVDPDFAVKLLLARAVGERSEEEQATIRDFFRSRFIDGFKDKVTRREDLARERANIEKNYAVTLITREKDKAPDTFVFTRGQYDQPDKERKVERRTPAVLPPLPEDAPKNRLGLARWLVQKDNPLTARVTVNRFWQQLYGVGLVKTAEDFGTQGERPVQQDVLDTLAVHFQTSGWKVKDLMKLLVMTDTYRQSSRVTPETYALDPENRLLARGARYRLDAEVIRDQALAVSGLLVRKIGGKPVRPYQPDRVWEAVAFQGSNTQNYKAGTGEDLHRRSLYTFIKRTAPPPNMGALDAPDREHAVARRERTNSPLAALVLLNDPQFIEASRVLAEQAVKSASDDATRLAWMFTRVTGRGYREGEAADLATYLESQLAFYRATPAEATALLAVGESKRDPALDPAVHAAWTLTASVLLNLDEVMCKN